MQVCGHSLHWLTVKVVSPSFAIAPCVPRLAGVKS